MKEKQPYKRRKVDDGTHKTDEVKQVVDYEPMKTSVFNAFHLRIGSWNIETENEGELVAKGYFMKKALAWEILRDGYKHKLEFEWSNIIGIEATTEEGKPGILELEVNQKPKFYMNLHSEPRKHIEWVDGSDFTEGQAFICRKHIIKFKPGVLNEHFERLISTDKRLFELSQKPFPSDRLSFFPVEQAAAPTQTFGFPPTMDIMNQLLRSMRISQHQCQPRPTYVTANPPLLAIYSEPRPLMSSSRAAPPMKLPMVRGLNNQMLMGHYRLDRAIPMASSSSVLLAQNAAGLAAPNVSSQPYLSMGQIEHFNSRVMNMRALQARMGTSNDVLMNHPTYSDMDANAQSSNQQSNLYRVANGHSLNEPMNSYGVLNGHLLNQLAASNGVANDHFLNLPSAADSNGVQNGNSVNWQTDSNGVSNNNISNLHTYSNDYSFNGPTNSNGNLMYGGTNPNEGSNDHFLNTPAESNGFLNDILLNCKKNPN